MKDTKFNDKFSAARLRLYDHTNRVTASPNSFEEKFIVCKYSHFCDRPFLMHRLSRGCWHQFGSRQPHSDNISARQWRNTCCAVHGGRCRLVRLSSWTLLRETDATSALAIDAMSPRVINNLVWENLLENSKLLSKKKNETKKEQSTKLDSNPKFTSSSSTSRTQSQNFKSLCPRSSARSCGCVDERTPRCHLPPGPARSNNGAVCTCRYVCTLCQSD